MSQLHLLRQRQFHAFFWVQFLGAFNDNLFKNALVIMIAYRSLDLLGLRAEALVAACGGFFILPFFLLSATAGQLADKFPKHLLIRWVKGAEIVIMALGAVGLLLDRLPLLLATLFLLGLQSTIFGPAKYSLLPELLGDHDLVGGNALVETGTFLAILLGTICGGVLIAAGARGPWLISAVGMTVAVAGFIAALRMLPTTAQQPDLRLARNPITPNIEILRATVKNRPVFFAIMGISWFWFFGAALLSLLPGFARNVLQGGEHVVTLFLALFCMGIAIGSLLCERLSGRKLELGLVPLGSIGISLFTLDLFLASGPFANVLRRADLLSVEQFLAAPGAVRICMDLLLLAIFSGFFTVPLYTMIQQRTAPAVRSRVIAGNNILNALLMVAAAVTLVGLLQAGLPIPWIFVVLALMNAAVAIFIYTMIPEFLLRFVAWLRFTS